MRHVGIGRRGVETQVIVWVIFSLMVLVVLLFFSGQISTWVNKLIDKLFGG